MRPFLLLLPLLVAAPALAGPRGIEANNPQELRAAARVEQRLGEPLPLEITFTGTDGNPVRVGDLFNDDKPVLITPIYYSCPMLCNLVLDQLLNRMMDLRLHAGRDFNILTYSFDPTEGREIAEAKKNLYLKRYGREGAEAGWKFVTGDPASIRGFSDALGFHYAWDPIRKEYAHGAVVIVATPDGRISRYFYGIEYSAKDLRLGLVDSSNGKIGSLVDQFLLLCYKYDPMSGTYSARAMNVVRMSGAVTVLGLIGFLAVMFRRERASSKFKK
jgi:protein SCO1